MKKIKDSGYWSGLMGDSGLCDYCESDGNCSFQDNNDIESCVDWQNDLEDRWMATQGGTINEKRYDTKWDLINKH